MRKLALLIAVAGLAAAGCNDKETRSGSITLSGATSIPLVDQSGARAELIAGPAQITFQKGSKDRTIAVKVTQPNRSDVNFQAPINGDPSSGNFTLRGADIGQPVDLVSARSYAVTGPTQSWENWEDQGYQRCLIETSYDPCDESWTVDFLKDGAKLGAFSSLTAAQCNVNRQERFCEPTNPMPPIPREPRPRSLDDLQSRDPSSVQFD